MLFCKRKIYVGEFQLRDNLGISFICNDSSVFVSVTSVIQYAVLVVPAFVLICVRWVEMSMDSCILVSKL